MKKRTRGNGMINAPGAAGGKKCNISKKTNDIIETERVEGGKGGEKAREERARGEKKKKKRVAKKKEN